MDDYISRQTAMNAFAEYVKRSNNSDFAPTPTWNDAVEIVENLPSADVQSVRHGHWINHGQYADFFPHSEYRCSICDQPYLEIEMWYNYCPNCGARMDEVAQNDIR